MHRYEIDSGAYFLSALWNYYNTPGLKSQDVVLLVRHRGTLFWRACCQFAFFHVQPHPPSDQCCSCKLQRFDAT